MFHIPQQPPADRETLESLFYIVFTFLAFYLFHSHSVRSGIRVQHVLFLLIIIAPLLKPEDIITQK